MKKADPKAALKWALARAKQIAKKQPDPELAAKALAGEVVKAGYLSGVLADRAALCMAQDLIHNARQAAIHVFKAPPPNPDRSTPDVLARVGRNITESILNRWTISTGKWLGDCTADDLRAEAERMRNQAQGCTVNATLYTRLAAPMEGATRVSEVWNAAGVKAELDKAQAESIVKAVKAGPRKRA